jgi:hypothetical protein
MELFEWSPPQRKNTLLLTPKIEPCTCVVPWWSFCQSQNGRVLVFSFRLFYIVYKRMTLGKTYGIKCTFIGNLGNKLQTQHFKPLGIWWEHEGTIQNAFENTKFSKNHILMPLSSPPLCPPFSQKERNLVSCIHFTYHQWMWRIYYNCVNTDFWPQLIVWAWIVGT